MLINQTKDKMEANTQLNLQASLAYLCLQQINLSPQKNNIDGSFDNANFICKYIVLIVTYKIKLVLFKV